MRGTANTWGSWVIVLVVVSISHFSFLDSPRSINISMRSTLSFMRFLIFLFSYSSVCVLSMLRVCIMYLSVCRSVCLRGACVRAGITKRLDSVGIMKREFQNRKGSSEIIIIMIKSIGIIM